MYLSLTSPISRPRSSLAADAGASGQPAPAAAPRRPIQMPDEYLPPNQVLFLQNLPEGTTKEDLQEVFEQSVVYRGLRIRSDNHTTLINSGGLQTPKPGGSSSYPHKTRHCLCRVRRRGQCDGGQGRFAQFQDRWGDKDEGAFIDAMISCPGADRILTYQLCLSRRIAGYVRKEVSEVVCLATIRVSRRTTGEYFVWGFCRLYISQFRVHDHDHVCPVFVRSQEDF